MNEANARSSWRCCATTRRRTASRTSRHYDVPCQEEWVVLDALNYVKDNHRPDAELPLVLPHGGLRQLRHDDQRRAEAGLQGLPARLRRA